VHSHAASLTNDDGVVIGDSFVPANLAEVIQGVTRFEFGRRYEKDAMSFGITGNRAFVRLWYGVMLGTSGRFALTPKKKTCVWGSKLRLLEGGRGRFALDHAVRVRLRLLLRLRGVGMALAELHGGSEGGGRRGRCEREREGRKSREVGK
jgi:hypothetical protein